MRKYELVTDSKIKVGGRTLFRVKALISFGDIQAGEVGGYVEQEGNLSQNGNAWVSGNAEVYGNAWVYGDAKVYDNAEVYGNAWVSGNAEVCGNAEVYGDAWVYGDAKVTKNPLNIIGAARFPLTAYAQFVQIGCKLHTVEEWDDIFRDSKYIDLAESEEAYQTYRRTFEFAKEWLKSR